MNSKLAEKIVADKGKTPRQRVLGIIVHTTGSGIVEHAKEAGADPEAFAVEHYLQAGEYPHYLIAHDGSIYAFCDELKWGAHAAWRPWERDAYRDGSWIRKWSPDYHDKVVAVDPKFYGDWTDRWTVVGRGGPFTSPARILDAMLGGSWFIPPNGATVGIEVLDAKPFTDAQIQALAALVIDIGERHNLPICAGPQCHAWPNVWCLGHSDIGPCRRWARNKADKGASPKIGYPWDPGNANLVWTVLGDEINRQRGAK